MSLSKPSFKEAYMNTYIGELPSIINNNFKEASIAFNNIVEYNDASVPYVKMPINTTGNVKATNGFFKNLSVENLTVEQGMVIDASSIMYDNSTNLKQKLDKIDASINEIIRQLELTYVGGSNSNTVLSANPLKAVAPLTYSPQPSLNANDSNLYISALAGSNSYTYNTRYYLMNDVLYDPSVFKCKDDYLNVVDKKVYRYYNVYNNKYVKIDNIYASCFRNCKIGDVVIPIFSDEAEQDFRIDLGSKEIIVAREDYMLTSLQLICVGVDNNGKCVFNIINYSGKISIA